MPAVEISGIRVTTDRDELLMACQDLDRGPPGRLMQPVAETTPCDPELGERLAVEPIRDQSLGPASNTPWRLAAKGTLGCRLQLLRQAIIENINVDCWSPLGQDTEAVIGVAFPLTRRAAFRPIIHHGPLAGDRNAIIAVMG
jgi:hypothetical protein